MWAREFQSPIWRLLRPRQWPKNVFVLAPLLYCQELPDYENLLSGFTAFLAFCLLSSVAYIFNDICDRTVDANHPVKRSRPLASGLVQVNDVIPYLFLLLVVSTSLAASLGRAFVVISLLYLGMQAAYSSHIKKVPVIESLFVALGFVVRVWAGTFAFSLLLDPGLIICSFLLALFLTLAKRHRELSRHGGEAARYRPVLASYNLQKMDLALLTLLVGNVLAYVLFIFSLEDNSSVWPGLACTVPFVALGLLRYYYLVKNQDIEFSGNPDEVLLRDRFLQTTILVWFVQSFWVLRL